MIWGDSYAQHLVAGIIGASNKAPEIIQATSGACGPLIGLAAVKTDAGYNDAWARSCIKFNDSVLDYLKQANSVEYVVLSSPFGRYVDHTFEGLLHRDATGEYRNIAIGVDPAVEAMKITVEKVRAMGKKVVLIAPPPTGGFNAGLCVERLDTGLPIIGVADSCRISPEARMSAEGEVLNFLHQVAGRAGINVIGFEPVLCSTGPCDTHLEGILVYQDAGHLTYEGSALLGRRLDLLKQIERQAR